MTVVSFSYWWLSWMSIGPMTKGCIRLCRSRRANKFQQNDHQIVIFNYSILVERVLEHIGHLCHTFWRKKHNKTGIGCKLKESTRHKTWQLDKLAYRDWRNSNTRHIYHQHEGRSTLALVVGTHYRHRLAAGEKRPKDSQEKERWSSVSFLWYFSHLW